jgi:[acyl-carrier-protein] S-malonyltransferase
MMQGRFAVLCPGQGGQHGRMFELLGDSTGTKELLLQWSLDAYLPAPLATLAGDRTDDAALFSNRAAQPLIVAATLAAWERLRTVLPVPVLIAGYSIGELSAYAVAGAFSPSEALQLAAARAGLMDECVRGSPRQALLAVTSPDLKGMLGSTVGAALHVAIETGPDSVILGGLLQDALAFEQHVANAGGRAALLPVSVASHTPLMTPAVAPFLAMLEQCQFKDPPIPVVSGLTANPVTQRGEAIRTLAQQLDETIRWQDCMDTCAEAGVTVALELGPGGALSRMLRERHPHIDCRSIDDFRSVEGIVKWLDRHGAQ